MALEYTSKIDGDLLSVTTRGCDDNVDEVVAYGESIIRLCIENQCNKVIVDERELTGVLDKVNVRNGATPVISGSLPLAHCLCHQSGL